MLCGTCRWKAVCLRAQGQQWPRWKKPCNELSKDFQLIEWVLFQVLLGIDELLKSSKPIGFTNVVFACKVRMKSYSTHCTKWIEGHYLISTPCRNEKIRLLFCNQFSLERAMKGFVNGAKVFFLALKEKHVGLSEFLYNFWLVTFSKWMIRNEKVRILKCHVVQFSYISFLCPSERFI